MSKRVVSSPRVSVIIPIYNVEQYVGECINSVLCQTYQNIEVLCIDDCGADNSNVVLTELAGKDSRIRIIKHEFNQGLGPSRNTGLHAARGEFVCFLDADDYMAPQAIEFLVKRIICDESDIAIGASLAFPDDSSDLLIETASKINGGLNLNGEGVKVVVPSNYFQLLNDIPCMAWGKLFRLAFIRENRLEFIDAKIKHEDEGFHVKYMACNPRISTIECVCYYYRIRFGSLMNFGEGRSTLKINDMKLSIEEALEYLLYRKKDMVYIEAAKDRYWSFFAYSFFGGGV